MGIKDSLQNPENQKPEETALAQVDVNVAELMSNNGDFDEENELDPSGGGTVYLDFMHGMKSKADDIREAIDGVKDGDPILYNGGYEALEGRLQVWAKMFQCYVQKDGGGNIVSAGMDKSDGKEYIVCLLNVIDGDRVFPAIAEVGGAKCRFVHDLVDAAKATKSENWVGGDKVRKGLTGLAPAFRVAGTLAKQEKRTRPDNDGNTYKYHIISAKCSALTFDEASALNAAIKGDSYGKQVAAAMEQYDRKVAELKLLM